MNSGSRLISLPLLAVALCAGAALLFGAGQALAQPVAVTPYTLTTLTKLVPPTGATAPDDLAVSADGADLWVGYGNGVDTSGNGGPSNVVEYDISSGAVRRNLSIPGHVDGLKINPATSDVWATENEDGNPTLAIINHESGDFKTYTFAPTLTTGGLDDLVFSGPKSKNVYLVASSQADPTAPVIIQISGKLKKTDTAVTSTLAGTPTTVWNVVTNKTETDSIGDPDSMTLDPAGELVLDNRSDDSLYIARATGAANSVLRVPLTLSGTPVEVNDTIFTTSATTGSASTAGVIYITDTQLNAIYSLTKPYFPANEVYTAANVVGDVGLVDLNSGAVTPVVTGFKGVHGLAFSPTAVAIAPGHGRCNEEGSEDC
jgi:hypothetical protein